MKVSELIIKLQKMPQDLEVCIFDHELNFKEDSNDGCSAGIYSEFEIEYINKDNVPDHFTEWVAISFTNRCIGDQKNGY